MCWRRRGGRPGNGRIATGPDGRRKHGVHGPPRVSAGDDLRRLDWAAYARSDKMIVKLYRQEVCPHLDIVLDGSCSMAVAGSEKCGPAWRWPPRWQRPPTMRVTPIGPISPDAAACPSPAAGNCHGLARTGVRLEGKSAGFVSPAAAAVASTRDPCDHQRPALARRPVGTPARAERPGLRRLRDPNAFGRRRRSVASWKTSGLSIARPGMSKKFMSTRRRKLDIETICSGTRELASGNAAGGRSVRAAGGRNVLQRLGPFAAGRGGILTV